MTLLAGVLAIGAVLLAIYALVWARWRVRDRRRRRNRLVERAARRDDLERAARRLRLRVADRDSEYCPCGAHVLGTPCYLGFEVRR